MPFPLSFVVLTLLLSWFSFLSSELALSFVWPLGVETNVKNELLLLLFLLFIISPIVHGLFNDALYNSGYITRISRIISKKYIKASVKWISQGIIWGTIPGFALSTEKKTQKTYFNAASLGWGISTWDLQKARKDYHPFDQHIIWQLTYFMFVKFVVKPDSNFLPLPFISPS
jgi:hypothetical protein